MDQPRFTVLLVGNYEHDEQTSMLQFTASLERGLRDQNVAVETIRPVPWFGRLQKSPTGLGKWLGYLDKFFLFPGLLSRKVQHLRQGGARSVVVHVCDHSNAHYTRYLQEVPHLVTCNDLLAIRSAAGEFAVNPTRWTGRKLQQLILHGLQRAHHVTCISEATRRDLLRMSGLPEEKTSVTYMGFNNDFLPMERQAAAKRVQTLLAGRGFAQGGDGDRFLLHVGSNAWYKNRSGVLRLYAALRRRSRSCPSLVFAGQPLNAELRADLEQRGLRDAVVDLGPVTHEELCALYAGADFLLFPSLEEGFGWPIIEAQACGCRVATTGKAPMTEVGGRAAVYLDLERETAALNALVLLLEEAPAERKERIRAGEENTRRFSRAEMVSRYLVLYQAALAPSPKAGAGT